MSLLLVVGVVLLLLLGGLALWQRRAARDMATSASRADSPALTAAASRPRAVPGADARMPTIDDPVIGSLKYHGDTAWTGEESLAIGGHDLVVQIFAGVEGPGDEHRAWMRTFRDRFDTIDADARALLGHVLQPLGVTSPRLDPWQVSIGPGDDGVFEGRLHYDVVHEAVDDLCVRSVEQWAVLEAHVDGEIHHGEDMPERSDPIAGRIAYSGHGTWSGTFTLGGRETQALYLAGPSGPGDEHHAWLEAALADGDGLVARAAALAADARGWDAADVTVTIVTAGMDHDGRGVGSLTCHARGGGPCYVFSGDRFQTLSLERG